MTVLYLPLILGSFADIKHALHPYSTARSRAKQIFLEYPEELTPIIIVFEISSFDKPLREIVNQFLTHWSWETSLIRELAKIPLPGADADLLVNRAISIAPWSQTAKLPPLPTVKIREDKLKSSCTFSQILDEITLSKIWVKFEKPGIIIDLLLVISAKLMNFSF